MRRMRSFVYMAAMVIGCIGSVHGQSTTWTGGNSNQSWIVPGNWSNGVPAPIDTAVFGPGDSSSNLGGGPRSVDVLQLNSDGTRTFTNGLLLTNRILVAPTDLIGEQIRLNGAIGTTGPTLRFDTQESFFGFQGTIGDGVGGGAFGIAGQGVLIGTHTYTGPTVGTFRIEGSIPNTSEVFLTRESGITALTGSTSVLPDNAQLTLRSAQFGVGHAQASQSYVERVGTLTIGIGYSSIEFSPQNQILAGISARALTRTRGAILNLDNAAFEFTKIKVAFDQIPADLVGDGGGVTGHKSVIRGVYVADLPFASSTTFATYDPGPNVNDPSDDVGVRPLDLNTDYIGNLGPVATGANVRVTAPQTLSSSRTVNSLMTFGDATITLSNAAALTVNSGMIALVPVNVPASGAASGIVGDGQLIVPGEAIVIGAFFSGRRPLMTIDVPITAEAITIARDTNVLLGRVNTIPGGTTITQASVVRSAVDGALGTGPLLLQNSTIEFGSSQTLHSTFATEGRTAFYGPGGFPLRADTGTITISGPISGYGIFNSAVGVVLEAGGGSISTMTLNVRHLEIHGTLAANDPGGLNVNTNIPDGVLSGDGAILGDVHSTIVAPGGDGSPGIAGRITVDKFAPHNAINQVLRFDLLGDEPGSEYDQLVALSSMSLIGGTHELTRAGLSLTVGFTPSPGQQFMIIDDRFAGAIVDTFNGLPEGSALIADEIQFLISYVGGDGNDVVLTVIPEPSSLILVFAPLAAIAFSGSRRRRVFDFRGD